MTLPPFHQPYSHRTRFKLVRSTTSLVKICRTKTIPSTPTNLVKNVPNRLTAPPLKAVSGTKYKWTPNTPKDANLNSFKLDNRQPKKASNQGRVLKRKLPNPLSKCLIQIRGVKFNQNPNGKSLCRLATDPVNKKMTPVKKAEPPTRSRANLLIQRSIQISNGRFRLRNSKKKSSSKKTNCIYFNRFGKCHRGDQCPFIHDQSRIAVCTQFLHGRCKNATCPYSHELSPGKVPTCSFFIKGACGQDNCPYAHSYVGHDAEICEDFAQGYCSKGIECVKKHVLLCPEFESKGQCSRGKQCHLTHRRKRVFNDDNHRPKASFNVEEATSLVENDNALPAFIPLTQEVVKKPAIVERKLKPSFLS